MKPVEYVVILTLMAKSGLIVDWFLDVDLFTQVRIFFPAINFKNPNIDTFINQFSILNKTLSLFISKAELSNYRHNLLRV